MFLVIELVRVCKYGHISRTWMYLLPTWQCQCSKGPLSVASARDVFSAKHPHFFTLYKSTQTIVVRWVPPVSIRCKYIWLEKMGRSEFETANCCNGANDLTTTTNRACCFIWTTKVYHLLDKSAHSEYIFFSLDFPI